MKVPCLPGGGSAGASSELLDGGKTHRQKDRLAAGPMSGREGRAGQPGAESTGLPAFAELARRAQPPGE